MSIPSRSLARVGRVLQIGLNLLLAVPALGLGAMTLFSPDVPAGALLENVIVGIALLATSAILVFDIYRPITGGVLLIVWAVAFAFIFNGFHLSDYMFPTRQVGFHVFWSYMTSVLLMLGILSLLRDRPG